MNTARSGSARLPMTRWAAVIVTVVGLTLAACGGSSKKAPRVASPDTTDQVASSTTVANGASADGATTTTANVASPAASTTTVAQGVKKSTVTTKKTATTVAAPTARPLAGGIATVVNTPTTQPSEQIQPGGTITFLKTAEIIGFDPKILNNSGASDGPAASMVFDLLVYSDPKTGTVKGNTVESLTSSDALVWTMTLRPNIKFTDGTPYDAAAVKFNWERLQDPKNAASRAAQANLMQSIDVVSPTTLRLTLKAKNAVFPQNLTLIPYIGSPQAIQQKGDGFNSDPVGAGPYRLKSWTRNGPMVLQRNPDYWNAPRPYLDQVIIRPILDEQQRVNTFMTGEANLMFTSDPGSADRLKKAGGVPNQASLNGGTNIYFNTRKPPFNDVRARQAIVMAIDRVDYAKVVNGGLLDPIHSVFRPDSPFYDPNILEPPYDPVKAQQLFDQLAQETGGPLTFTLYTFNASSYTSSAEYMQGVLNKFKNVKMTIDAAASPAQQSRVIAGNYTIAAFGNPFDDPEPGWTNLYTCAANPSFTGWCNAKFDAAVDAQRVALDPKEWIAQIKEAQKQFYAEVPSFYYSRGSTYLFTAPNIQDFEWANDGLPLLDRPWIKTRG